MGRDTQRAAQVSLRRIALATALLAVFLIPAAAADNGAPDHFMLGTIPTHGPHVPPGPPVGPPGPGGLPGPAGPGHTVGTNNLSYHGGPVLHTNTTYAIYWSPGGAVWDVNYQADVNGFFTNVANAKDSTGNVYGTDVQYYDNAGSIKNESTFGGAFPYTAAIPNNPSCVKQYTSAGMTASGGCVLDSDIENVVSAVASANHLAADGSSIFFVFTPKDVGSCWSTSGNTCAYNYYCAYHSDFSTGAGSFLYADMPYPDSSDVLGYQDCSEPNGFPNSDWADPVLSVTSHEHNETITDPYGTAWYDAQGNENGDKCAWNFGNRLGSTGTNGDFNQVISGGQYYLQQEWSNTTSSCVQTYTPPAPPPTISGLSTTSGTPGTAVTITGTNLSGATVKFGTTAASISSDTGTQITTSVPSTATSGPVTVTTPSGSISSAFTVIIPDFQISLTPTSQTVKRGSNGVYTVSITATNGFNGSVKLAIGGLPGGANGLTATFNPSSVTGTGTSTLTIVTKSNSRTGTSNFTVTATSGTLKHTANGSINVQ